MRRPGSVARHALLGTALAAVAGTGGCYDAYMSSCAQYYGYYDYYCSYEWYDVWWFAGYDWYYFREIPVAPYPNPDPAIAARLSADDARVEEIVLLAPGAPSVRPVRLGEDFSEAYPCGAGDLGLTLCDDSAVPVDVEDEHLVLAMNFVGGVDEPAESDTVVIGWAFDTDEDRDNNFVSTVEAPNLYFEGTDLWYTATFTPGEGWALSATDVRGGAPQSVPTNARVVFDADTVALVVPLDDFVVSDPGVRLSYFRHAGDGGAGGDWTGFVHPLPGDELIRPIPR